VWPTRRRTRGRGSACRRNGRIGATEARGSHRRRACGRLSRSGLGSSSSSIPTSACRFCVCFLTKWERVFNGVVWRKLVGEDFEDGERGRGGGGEKC
jgi:hypothetical protein